MYFREEYCTVGIPLLHFHYNIKDVINWLLASAYIFQTMEGFELSILWHKFVLAPKSTFFYC